MTSTSKVDCVVMCIRNVNFDSGIVNGRKGIVQAISSRIVDVEIIGDGSPLVRIPRITFEVKVGKDGMTFHRKQFPLRVCYAMTINKSQGQTLSRVGLHLRDDVFCHGQLYVALSRATSCSNIVCLVKPERIINGVPHVANSVYEPFITAATGRTLPAHSTVFYHPPTWPSANPSSTSHQSQHATSSTSSQGVHAAWSIVDEIGDGACLLRTISRRVFHDLEHHPQVRQQVVSHILGNAQHFVMHIPGGFGSEQIRIQGSPLRMYHSLHEYLDIMSLPTAYAGYIEIAAAQQIYTSNINIEVVAAGNILPSRRHKTHYMSSSVHTLFTILPYELCPTMQLLCNNSRFFLHYPPCLWLSPLRRRILYLVIVS